MNITILILWASDWNKERVVTIPAHEFYDFIRNLIKDEGGYEVIINTSHFNLSDAYDISVMVHDDWIE